MCVFTLFGCLEGGAEVVPKGQGHNLLVQFSTVCSSKMEMSQTDCFDILAIQNDQIPDVKHVLHSLYVVFTLFGCFEGALRRLRREWGTTCLCSFLQLKNGNVPNRFFFYILAIHNDQKLMCVPACHWRW